MFERSRRPTFRDCA